MRRNARWVVGACALLVSASSTMAGKMPEEPYAGSPEFERMKTLVGVWKGRGGKENQPVTAEYKLTGGGSAIVETLWPGSEQEMVTVYHDRYGRLGMTHYCSLGNQPEMVLTVGTERDLSFTLAKGSRIDVKHESHMHDLTITWTGDDEMTHDWTMYAEGEEEGVHTFAFSRVQ